MRAFWIKAGLLLSLAGAVAAGVSAHASGAESGVSRVRFGGGASETRIVIEMGRGAQGRMIETPSAGARRLVLALPGVGVGSERSGTGFGLVGGWRLEESAGAARLQLELRQDAHVVRRFLLPPADGVTSYRYVLDLASGVRAAGAAPAPTRAAAAAAPTPSSSVVGLQRASTVTAPAPALTPVQRPRGERRTVVIDAGHGGRDPGALGAVHRESAVTLSAARALKARLERGGYRVVMTRSTNVFVPLQQRVRIAREARADLFISLHADAGPSAQARGASVYTLSDQGSNRVAQRMLSGDSWFMNVELPGADRSVNQILFDLTQRATVNESSRFAGLLLTGIADHARVRPSGHRNAGFVVLLAPDVPAVLLEMGFMTNADDERQLGSPERTRRFMDAVGDSIDRYFARSAGARIAQAAATGG